MKYLIAMIVALLVSCGGCGGPTPPVVSIYGDSITSGGNAQKIAGSYFKILDYSVGGKHSDSPLDPGDYASVVILRYGMADAAHGLKPYETRRNLLELREQIRVLGKRAIVINVSRTPSGFESLTNSAIADITDIDVSYIKGETLDGIHPDEAFYEKLNSAIQKELLKILELS